MFVKKVLGQTTVTQQYPLLPELRDPASSPVARRFSQVPTCNKADHMVYVKGLAQLELEPPRRASQLAASNRTSLGII